MDDICKLPLLNLVFYVINIIVTYVSQTGAFGETISMQSKKYTTLLTPSGFAFAIWGLIFSAELVFSVLPFFDQSIRKSENFLKIGYWWVAACTFQCFWTAAFCADLIWLALLCMLSIWFSLAMILYNFHGIKLSWKEFGVLVAPFQLHFGWITAASAVNVLVTIQKLSHCYRGKYASCTRQDVGHQLSASVVLLALLTALGFWLTQQSNAISTLVLCWSTLAMCVQLNTMKEDFPEFYASVGDESVFLGLGAATLTLTVLLFLNLIVRTVYSAVFSEINHTIYEMQHRP